MLAAIQQAIATPSVAANDRPASQADAKAMVTVTAAAERSRRGS